ncbi:SigE family RNA polymerase sigma factor [Acidothermaceae bacterium B102]|nr:SigE family RNA polymerase sigma factor [Acidothermaceae bacterium B102]
MTTGEVDAVTGDVAALYAATGRRLVGLLVSAGATPALAEDLLQEAYARLVPRWDAVQHYDNPEAWVRTVALRLYLSHERRARLFHRRAPILQSPAVGEGPSPDRVVVEAALAQLPAQQRVVVVLHYLVDLSVDDIATTLRIAPGTVKSRLSRARAHLADVLGEDRDE